GSSIFVGEGESVDPSDPSKFITLPPVSITIASLTLQDGAGPEGGAIDDRNVGGTLSVNSCTFTRNLVSAPMSTGEIAGGAIYSTSKLSVDLCTFSQNHVIASLSAAKATSLDFSSGGAIEEDGDTLSVTNSTFEQ